ncbi:VCBS repeat-containing protein [Winogradskyella echinorum]|uniref:VCBS repeat-containing protein n=1 Tax=Winogradskyella echinorum TaxID=538189 RepID=A0ABR6Y2R3_9FLAO|nr:VCBS repeat-containing protein [Winogradskyella echinorum]MBC3847027.1 VCBS repeat-containing protein [Winogradskyella echinorum]MBC5751375.1 VCBS repeat-containing protein [Winogradskyella echinorum]
MKKITLTLVAISILLACSNDVDETIAKQNYLLNQLSEKDTGIDFSNIVPEDAQHSIINYIYYYNGGGVAAGDINNDGLSDLYFVSNTGDNKLYINKGNLKFEDVSKNANISGSASWNTGATMVDINNDGLLDIYVCAVSGLLDFKGHNELFINNGDGTFTEKAKDYGLDFKGYSTQAYFFDYDKDDDLDVYIVNHAVHTTLSHGKAELRHKRAELVGDVLLNNNNGKFSDVSDAANIFGGVNGYGLSASVADFNNDGWDDIYVCNDFHEDDYYYINNQDGTFTESLADAFTTISRFSMGSDAADINGDGYQDLMTLDMLPKSERILKETEGDDAMFNMQVHLKKLGYKDQYSRNMLQINNSGNSFQETALFNQVADTDWSWAPLFADFNNDGHQDLFISNGILRRPNGLDFKKYVSSAFKGRTEKDGLEWLFNSINEMNSGKVSNEMFEGNSIKFKNKTGDWIENKPNLSNGAIYIDLDLDGDLDLVTNNFGETAGLYENTTNSTKNYISLDFEYKGANKEGIGLKAIVYNNDKRQLKQLFKSRGFLSSLDSKLHFGLDDAVTIDSIQIIWPNNEFQTIKNPTINQNLKVSYSEGNSVYNYSKIDSKSTFKKENFIDFTHKEDNYNDFSEEKLIPYKISTFGPALAKADIDGNGFEDVFIGNSSGQPAHLFLNSGSGFSEMNITEITNDATFEDNDAEFFDADNDGDLDLYIASGINERKIDKFQEDRLYINENGKFVRSKLRIPINWLVTTTVEAYDYDKDGDIDLFVGNLADAKDFGKTVKSNILVNDGKGNFSIDTNFELFSKVTSAKWEDVNGDNVKDLIVSTEWDEPKIYINKKGVLEVMDLPDNLNGLWQTVSTFDIDNDGDQDILLGNWGLNTKFNLNFDGPLVMYYSDFDENGKNETLIAYNKNGKYYPLNSKDELAAQMNVISKIYVDHKSFAGKTIEEAITKGSIAKAQKFEVHTLASGYLRNDNGSFSEFVKFEDAFQLAPITTFSELEVNDEAQLMVGGNSYKVNTYHGSYSALKGLLVKDTSNYQPVSNLGIDPFNQQIKQIETLKMKDKNLVIILSNNDELKLYSFQN